MWENKTCCSSFCLQTYRLTNCFLDSFWNINSQGYLNILYLIVRNPKIVFKNKIQSRMAFHTVVSHAETVHTTVFPALQTVYLIVLMYSVNWICSGLEPTKCEKVYVYCVGFEYLLLFLDSEAQYMVILFMVFIVQFSVSSACLAINREQQVRWSSSFSPLKQLLVGNPS